jgi:hypothetical protein
MPTGHGRRSSRIALLRPKFAACLMLRGEEPDEYRSLRAFFADIYAMTDPNDELPE